MDPKDTIIFDFDGVVLDSGPLWDKATDLLLERRGITYETSKKDLWMGKNGIDMANTIMNAFNFTEDPEVFRAERVSLVRYLYLRNELKFVEGFKEFFTQVQESGLKTCIATSCDDEVLSIACERLNIKKMFGDNIYSISEVNFVSKPNPDIFLYAAQKVDSNPKNCIVIEDSPNGVEAAKNANMFCIGILTTVSEDKLQKADIVVKSYQDINLESLL